MAAQNPLAIDAVATAMMGFDIDKIKQVREGFNIDYLPLASFGLETIKILGNTSVHTINDVYADRLYTYFEASRGFKGNVEYIEN